MLIKKYFSYVLNNQKKVKINKVFGYARVSMDDQNLDHQLDALNNYGVDKIYNENMGSTKMDRPELKKMLDVMTKGDTVVIESLSHLGRSIKDLIELVGLFESRGIHLVSLKESINTSTSTGKFFFTVISDIAQFERDIITDRTKEGLKAARARGHFGGRPKKDPEKVKQAIELYQTRDYTCKEIENLTGVNRSTIYRYLNKKDK